MPIVLLKNQVRSLLLLVLISFVSTTLTSGMTISFSTLDRGSSSGIEHDLTQSYHTLSEFESFWKDHTSHTHPPPPVPPVNFESHMVVCVFTGTKSSGGYDIEITSVESVDVGKIVINYQTSDPPPGGMNMMMLTQPHHIIQVSKVVSTKDQVTFAKMEKKHTAVDNSMQMTWMVGFKKDLVDRDAVVKFIESHDTVERVRLLKGVGLLYVYFKPGMYDSLAAEEAFLKSVDGVDFAEADKPMGMAQATEL